MLVATLGIIDGVVDVPAASAAPGTPGVPSDPAVLFEEDFEQGSGLTEIEDYVSLSGATYTADPFWLNAAACNGFVVSYAATYPGGAICSGQSAQFNSARRRANALGLLNSPQNAATNRAVSSNTSADGPNNARMFVTSQVPVPANGRFITFSVDAAASNCTTPGTTQPRLQFSLTDGGGAETPVSNSAINPCTDPRTQTTLVDGSSTWYGRFPADSSILYNSDSLGVTLRNLTGSGVGNDGAFDNIRILDATPQLDKSFSPTSVPTGGVSTLTLTVTNTSELAEKVGWSFTDSLPAGLTVSTPSSVGGTCVATVAAAAGGSAITVTDGRLDTGQSSCTITVDVTAAVADTYSNCAANITSYLGLNLPACASVSFFDFEPCVAVPIWTNTAGALQQYSPTDFSLLSSTPLAREYGDIAWSSNGSVLYGVDFDAGLGVAPVLRSIDPVTGAELTSVNITGPLLTQGTVPGEDNYHLNSLTALDANTLLVGSYASRAIWKLDIATGVTTFWTQYPNQITSAGDFTVLPDGDILAFGVRPQDGVQTESRVYRIHPAGSMTQIGTVPSMWGGAQSGGDFYMAAPGGEINRIPLSTLPTAASTAVLPYTTVLSGGPEFWGASAVQDAGECVGLTIAKTPTPAVITGPGETVTYEFTVTNISDVRIESIVVTDVQQAPAGALTSGPTCPVTALDPGQSTVCAGTYVATEADVDHGRIDDTATAAGVTQDGRDVTSNEAAATVLVEPVLTWSMSKTASVGGTVVAEGAVVEPGEEITYTVTALSEATVDIDVVTLSDDLTDVLDDAAFVPGSGQLVVDGGAPAVVADPAGTTLTAGPFTLPIGATATLTYRVLVNDDAWSATLTNVVTGTAGTPGEPIDPEPCDEDCSTTQITPTPVQIQKVGEASTGDVVPMDGSEWAIFAAATGGTALVDPVPGAVSGGTPVTGLFRDVTLTAGTYWLEETHALDGFALLAERVPFTVAADGAITLGGGVASNVEVVDIDGVPTIRVEDVPVLDLPDAGGPGTGWISLSGLILLLVGTAVGALLLVRQRRMPSAADHEPEV